METDFSDEPGWFCDGGPHRAVQNQGSCCTGRPSRTVRYRKRPCGVRSPHYGAGKFAPSVSQKRKAVLEVRISEPPGAGISHSEIGKRLPEGPHKRRGGASASCRRQRSSGDARRRHRRSPRTRTPLNGLTKKCSSEHRRGRGISRSEIGKRLERRRGLGDMPRFKRIRPDKKAGPAARGRPLNFAVTGGYYSSTIGLYLGTRAFMMLHAST